MNIIERPVDISAYREIKALGINPLLAKLYSSRGAALEDVSKTQLKDLINPALLHGVQTASDLIADALQKQRKITVVGDYDCDGCTATVVAIRGLRAMFEAMGGTKERARELIDFLVPNRFEFGYGLSPEIVKHVAKVQAPDMIITVDNGISSVSGVEVAKSLGIQTVLTDHHLPGDVTPQADAIVNPNQMGCTFPSKNLAGVGVMFYTLMVLRKTLAERKLFAGDQPRLDFLLDVVALGTVADVVKLDANNRRLVSHGLRMIRAGNMCPGIKALFEVSGRNWMKAGPSDFGFSLGPRLNAAGRLADMSIGIRCLLSDSIDEARALAYELSEMNKHRKEIEAGMKADADQILGQVSIDRIPSGIVLCNSTWHHGVVGILASRIKDSYYRPTIVFAPEENGQLLRGSGRSIPGVHLRDVIDLVVKRMPEGACPKFGGHAAAAGLTIRAEFLEIFTQQFQVSILEMYGEGVLQENIETDGKLPAELINADTLVFLESQVWGQGFPPPQFCDEFLVGDQKLLKDQHSKFNLIKDGMKFNALRWKSTQPLSGKVKVLYRFEKDDFTGGDAIQIIIDRVCSE